MYMANIPLFTSTGAPVSKSLSASDAVFATTVSIPLVHQVFVALLANAREPWAHSKNRGEVRGGGKKPWKQKGTGRARHGSIRSPIWVGGGVAFGPLKERNYSQKINKKMGTAATRMCLTDKLAQSALCAVESFPETGKTKDVVALGSEIAKHMPLAKKSTLVVVEKKTAAVVRSFANMPRVTLVRASDVNAADLLNHQCVLADAAAIAALDARLSSRA